jgi:hypothetical protein
MWIANTKNTLSSVVSWSGSKIGGWIEQRKRIQNTWGVIYHLSKKTPFYPQEAHFEFSGTTCRATKESLICNVDKSYSLRGSNC